MNHQTTWNRGALLKTGASLLAGVALCTWLGSHAVQPRHASPGSVGSVASMAQQIAMPDAHRDRLMAAPKIMGKFYPDMEQAREMVPEAKPGARPDMRQDDKLNAVKVRSAIFTLPVLKSTSGRSGHIQGVVS